MFDTISVYDKSILKSIPRMIRETGSKTEVYNRLKDKIPEYQNNSLARRIAAYTTDEIQKKFRTPVYILVLLCAIYAISELGSLYVTFKHNLLAFPVLFVAALILGLTIVFIFGFLKYKLFAYTTAISLCSLSFISIAINLFFTPDLQTAVSFVHTIITIMFLHFLRKNLFPEITFWGNVRSDKEKVFKFSS